MKYTAFEFSVIDNVGHIRLNCPDRGNPFDKAFCEEFKALSVECGERDDVRAVLIDAAGKNFSVGGDLKSFLKEPERLPLKFKQMTADLHMGVARFARNDEPVVLAAHSLLVGGAVALAAGADFVYATPESRFYAAFAAISVCGDTGVSYFLPRRVGSRKALEFLMLNEMWTAEKALEAGLINGIVEQEKLFDHCMTIAKRLANGPTQVYGQMRRLLLNSFGESIDTQLEMEARSMVDCARSPETIHAMLKVLNKA
jgi:2-(1,2-epoxy-1,2-dihydrophenyl)acetyl-CoA isomerase